MALGPQISDERPPIDELAVSEGRICLELGEHLSQDITIPNILLPLLLLFFHKSQLRKLNVYVTHVFLVYFVILSFLNEV